MSQPIQALIASARKGEHGTVHLLVGEETFLVERAIKALRKASVGEGIAGLSEDLFHGNSTSASAVVGAARTLAMMSPTRFVLVRGIDKMSPSDLDELAAYVEGPAPSPCLVLTAEKLDGRSKLAKAAQKARVRTDVAPLKGADLAAFAQAEARGRGHALSPNATQHLLDALGDDLAAIDDAIERLSLYVGKDAPIDVGAIDACIERLRTETIWVLVDALALRDVKRATHALRSLLADREEPLKILAMISRQMRMIARMREALASGMREPEAATAAGAPPWKSGELAKAAQRYQLPELTRTFASLAALDRALKSSKVPSDVLILETVVALCRPHAA